MATATRIPADTLDGAVARRRTLVHQQEPPAGALAHGAAKSSDIRRARRELGAAERRAAARELEAAAARHRRHAGATKAGSASWTAGLRFEVYKESSGRHRWRLATSDGKDLATSCESFASRHDAERAAGHVRR
jgi:uncharacterized protein YegP (UPF0339 family)